MKSKTSGIGLVIEPTHFAVAQVRGDANQFVPHRATVIERTEPQDGSDNGSIGEEEATRLRSILKRRGYEGSVVTLSMNAPRLLTGMAELPPRSSGAPVERLAGAELARIHRCDADKIVAGVWELPEGTVGKGEAATLVMGCESELALGLIEPLELAGFDVAAIDAHPAALSRIEPVRSAIGVVVEIGAGSATIALRINRDLIYVRAIPAGGVDTIEHTLSQEHGLNEQIVCHVLEDVGSTTRKPDAIGRASRAVDAWASRIAEACARAAEYARGIYGGGSEDSVITVGIGAMIPGVADAIAAGSDLRREESNWEPARKDPRLASAIALAGRFDA